MEVEFGRHDRRPWQNEFLSASYRDRHWALRLVIQGALRFPRLVDAIVGRSPVVIEWLDRTTARRIAQWSLSAIYATDYWRAVADELGGRRDLDALIRRYRPTAGQQSETPLWDDARRLHEATPKGPA